MRTISRGLIALMFMPILFVMFGASASASEEVETGPCATVNISDGYQVVRGPQGTRTVLAEIDTSGFAGMAVTDVSGASDNNSSVHPGNNIEITSPGASGSIMLTGVEDSPGTIYNVSGTIPVLGNSLVSTLIMGPDGVYSGGFHVAVTVCEQVQSMSLTAQIHCTWDDKNFMEVFTLSISEDNPHGLEVVSRSHEDGQEVENVATDVVVTYIDNFGDEQHANATVHPTEGCAPAEIVPPNPTVSHVCVQGDDGSESFVTEFHTEDVEGITWGEVEYDEELAAANEAFSATFNYTNNLGEHKNIVIVVVPAPGCEVTVCANLEWTAVDSVRNYSPVIVGAAGLDELTDLRWEIDGAEAGTEVPLSVDVSNYGPGTHTVAFKATGPDGDINCANEFSVAQPPPTPRQPRPETPTPATPQGDWAEDVTTGAGIGVFLFAIIGAGLFAIGVTPRRREMES